MTNIQYEIWKIIEKDPTIQLGLERELINVRALARYIGKQLRIDASEDAIISAIRRFPRDHLFKNRFEQARTIVGKSALSTRSNIVNIALAKGKDAQDALPALFTIINFERGETLRIVEGEESIKLLVDQKNVKKVLEHIPKRTIIKIHEHLAEINLHLHPEAVNTPGIMLVVSSELMVHGVNIYEIMSCVPELLIFVEEKDALRAYQVLFELCQNKKD